MPNAGLIARLRLIALCGLVALLATTGTVRAATLYQFNGNLLVVIRVTAPSRTPA